MSPTDLPTNWENEQQSIYLYLVMVEVEPEERKRRLFQSLAEESAIQAKFWEAQMESDGTPFPRPFRPGVRLRLVGFLLRRLGVKPIMPILSAMKVRGLSVYRALPPGHSMPPSPGEESRRHRGVGGGGTLRAAVFGVNDGLVSTTSLILGVAGATSDPHAVILAGVAGLLAGALSMAAGEYISMRSQREVYEYQIGLEKEELELYPDEEAEELALIYHTRGIDIEEARSMARSLIEDPQHALDTLAREELGLNPNDLGSPWGAALFSFLSFSTGGFLPLVPYLLGGGPHALYLTAVLAAVGLFAVGTLLSLFTGRNAIRSGLRMVGIGLLAGITTFTLGRLLGVSLS